MGEMIPQVIDSKRLGALNASNLLGTAPDESFDRLTRLVCRSLNVPVSLVSLVAADHQFFKSHHGLPEPWATARQTPLTHSFCQYVVASGAELRIDDARDDPLVCDNLAIPVLGVEAYLGVPLRDPDGHVLGALCAIDGSPRQWTDTDLQYLTDMSAVATDVIMLHKELDRRRKAEDVKNIVIRELHHRVKNTLSTVQALFALSYNANLDAESTRDVIFDRIKSMADTHDLLVRDEWQEVSLRKLIDVNLDPYGGAEAVSVSGKSVAIASSHSLFFGMILHELATNAAKYGALSNGKGSIAVEWTVESDGTGQWLGLSWTETGGPQTRPPEAEGFGSSLVNRLVTHQFSGRAEFDFRPEGLRVDMALKLPVTGN